MLRLSSFVKSEGTTPVRASARSTSSRGSAARTHAGDHGSDRGSEAGRGSEVGDAAMTDILARLDAMGEQLDKVASGQAIAESMLKAIHQHLGARHSQQADRLGPLADRRGSIGPSPPHGPSSWRRHTSVDMKGVCFWPRQELQHLHSSSRPQMGRTVVVNDSMTSWQSPTRDGQGRRCRPMHPDSWWRALFDLICIVVLLYDSLLIPYQLAWEVPFDGWLFAVSWMTALFWVIELILGFFTGYHLQEEMVMQFGRIAKHHLVTAFFPNLFVIVADIAGNVLEMVNAGGDPMREKMYIKLTRFMKLNRVLRLSTIFQHSKVAQVWDSLAELMRKRGLHDHFTFLTRITKLVFSILWVNHVGGCVWHMVGKDATEGWYVESNVQGGGVFDYMLAVYWSASSTIAGESVMTPTTTWELVMNVFYVMAGFIFSSVLISSILSAVIEYQAADKDRRDKIQLLRQFLLQHSVDSRVSEPMVKQVSARMATKKWLSEGDVTALSLLSQKMHMQLWYSIYGHSLASNPALCAFNAVNRDLISRICYQALKYATHKPGARLFEPFEEAEGARFVYMGTLEYVDANAGQFADPEGQEGDPTDNIRATWSAQQSIGSVMEVETVEKGTWISEVSLWVHWLHRGCLDATRMCEVLMVTSESLVKTLGAVPELHRIVKAYAACILTALKEDHSQNLTDLRAPVSHQAIVTAMPLDARILLSQGALKSLRGRQLWSSRFFQGAREEELRAEVEAGVCDLIVDATGQVKRAVTVVALCLCKEDGAVLMQVGKYADGVCTASCQRPGMKVRAGEYPKAAAERLLASKLGALGPGVRLGDNTVAVEEKVSGTYGVKTRYLRTVFEATALDLDSGCMKFLDRGVGRSQTETAMDRARSLVPKVGVVMMDPTGSCSAFAFRKDLTAKGTLSIYAWLTPQDCELLSSARGAPFLQKWMAELLFDNLDEDSSNGSSNGSERAMGGSLASEFTEEIPQEPAASQVGELSPVLFAI